VLPTSDCVTRDADVGDYASTFAQLTPFTSDIMPFEGNAKITFRLSARMDPICLCRLNVDRIDLVVLES
jgi:hypothetical protein